VGKPKPYPDTHGYIRQNSDNTEGIKVPIGKDGRLIVSHAGSPSFGFVQISKLVFWCKSGRLSFTNERHSV